MVFELFNETCGNKMIRLLLFLCCLMLISCQNKSKYEKVETIESAIKNGFYC